MSNPKRHGVGHSHAHEDPEAERQNSKVKPLTNCHGMFGFLRVRTAEDAADNDEHWRRLLSTSESYEGSVSSVIYCQK